ncbi:hypothetical protein [Saccharothrix algeriensis]|uniref:Uncharacterized protein n=3 Tax=Saccharothrix algeriensis TaxID=173560 RepID=A0ABS2S5U9_9PSEU|nr:hypothetical protein [Saccharothrix algeriensis]MBM7810476.1 hypothetical protein [Saccharothrix algeriensis]
MIDDWYFCSCVDLSPQETQTFLDVLECLRPNGSEAPGGTRQGEDPQLLLAALAELARLEPAARRYALLPVLAAGRRHSASPKVVAAVRREVEHSLETLDQSVRAPLRQAVRTLLDDSGDEVVGHLTAAARSTRQRPLSAASTSPYLDTEDFTAEVLLLSVTLQVLRQEPTLVEAVVERDDLVGLVHRALNARLGRRALILAVDVAAFAGDRLISRDELRAKATPDAEALAYEPDLLAAHARLAFGSPGSPGHDAPAADAVDAIRGEVFTLELLRGIRRRPATPTPSARVREAVTRLGVEGDPAPVISAVLWQSVLWELAVDIDATATSRLVAECWIPEHRPQGKVLVSGPVSSPRQWRQDLTDLSRLRTGPDAEEVRFHAGHGALRASSLVAVLVLSPWVNRVDNRWSNSESKFPRGKDGLVLLRLFCAVPLAVRLLRTVRGTEHERERLVALTVHAADVLLDKAHRRHVTALAHNKFEAPSMTRPLSALALHVKRVVDRAGQGKFPTIEPRWFVDFAVQPGRPHETPRQESLLRGVPATNVVDFWVTDALSAAVPDDVDRLAGRWLAPVGEPGSRSLAEWALDHSLRLQPRGIAAKPAALLAAYLRVDDTARTKLNSWHKRVTADQVRSVWEVIGVGWLTAADWRDLPTSPVLNPKPEVVRAMTTERLLAVFHDADARSWPEVDRWVDEWRAAHQEVREVVQLSRPARMRLVDLLATSVPGDPSQRVVLEDVIDIELEFGMGTPADRWALFDRLSRVGSPYEQLEQALRMRLLLGLYHRRSVAEERSSAQSPWEVITQERSDALLDRLLQSFVFRLGRSAAPVAGREHLHDTIPALWQTANQTHDLVRQDVALTDRIDPRLVDGRRLLGVTVDPVRDTLQLHLARRPLLTTGGVVLDPHQLGAGEVGKRLGPGIAGVAGVVCAATPTSVWVNCGVGAPVEADVPPGGGVGLGDLVAVPLARSTHPAYRATGPVRFLEGEPQIGDIRPAAVTGHEVGGRTWLRITLASGRGMAARSWTTDRMDDLGDAVALRRWDPDVLRALAGRPVTRVETMVRWDGGRWLPVDWGMPEFLATDVANSAGAPLRLVLIDDLRDAEALRCSSAPGRVVVIPDSAWYPDDLRELRADVEARGAFGLAVSVEVADDNGRPRLRIVADDRLEPEDRRVDHRNARWREHFRVGDETWAVRGADGVWRCATNDPDLPEIVVEGLASEDAATGFVPVRWEDADQRRARVEGRAAPSWDLRLGRPAVGEFRRIVDLDKPDRLRLNTVLPGVSWGLMRGYTAENLPVDIEAESLTLGPVGKAPLDRHLVKGRELQVASVYHPAERGGPRDHSPLPTEELLGLVGHDRRSVAEDALVRAKELRGLVVSVPKRGGSTPGSRPDRGSHRSTVWLEAQDTVFSVSLPHSAFEHPPTGVGAIVSARLTRRGWVFTAHVRKVRVRALWTVSESDPTGDRDLFLGVVQWRGRPGALIQSASGPTLHITPTQAWRSSNHLSKARSGGGGVDPATGSVETSGIFSHPYQRIALRIGAGERAALYAGETRETNPGQHARATAIHMRLRQVDAHHVVVQRVFTLDDARGSGPVPVPAPGPDSLADYRHYLAGPRLPLAAQLGGGPVRLTTGWQVPVAGRPSWTVPLAEGERPWVDATYDRGCLVVLCGDEHDQRVSYRRTPPVALDRFVAEFERQGLVVGVRSVLRTPLNYVDRRTTPRGVVHRLEWGYGKVVEVLDQDLTLDGASLSTRSKVLFHGDVVRAVTVTAAARGEYRLDIATRDLRWGWYSQIFHEADQGTVHLAEVELDPDGERARIVRVHTQDPNGRRGDNEHRGVTTVRLDRAQFGPAARELVKQAWLKERSGTDQDSAPVHALVKLRTGTFLDSRGDEVHFDYLTPHQLPAGSRVLMTATGIRPLVNDVRLHLVLADVLGAEGRRPLTVGVIKRDFSRRSQLLQNIYQSGGGKGAGEDELRGSVYLVKLRGHAKAIRSGLIRDALSRNARALVSLLHNAEAPCLAAVTPLPEQGRVELEIEPNVVFKLALSELSGATDLPRGSLARLSLDRDNRIELRTALIGDSAYLPAEGRPVLLLPMQNTVSAHKTAREALSGGTYSVAGLPSVTVRAAKPDTEPTPFERTLITTPHPRVAWLRPTSGGTPVLSDAEVAAGTVAFEGAGNAVVVATAGGERHPIRLSALSFFDGSALQVAERVQRLWWTYHDTTTSHRDPDNPDLVVPPTALPRRAKLTTEPAFFSPGWTLRHKPQEIPRYGFPATGLIDVLTHARREATFPVAALSGDRRRPDGVWVEQAPGRLVHLTGAMLTARAGDTTVPLGGFAWEHLAPGDLLRLRAESTTSTEIPSIVLRRWTPGPRGAFGAHALLPVAAVDRDAGLVRLGAGVWLLDFPLEPGTEPPNGHVRLTPGNEVVPPSPPRPRDVVLLGLRDGELEVLGAPGTRVTLADGGWAGWMREALSDPAQRARLIGLCRGAIPVTVEEADAGAVTVSRSRQGDFALKADRLVPVRPLGGLADKRVLLRRGGKLSLCQERDLVPGLPAHLLDEVVERLAGLDEELWIHTDSEGRLRVGLPDPDADAADREEVSLRPLALMGGGDERGVLCWDTRRGRPRWLPATAIGWTDLTDDEVERHVVRGQRELAARVLRDGTASMARRAVNEQRSRHLRAGDAIRVEIVDTHRVVDERRVRFLARAHLSDMLLRVDRDPLAEPPEPGSVVVCEVDSVRFENGRVVVVAAQPGTRRVAVDLPQWITRPERPDRPPMWSEADGAAVHAPVVAAVRAGEDIRAVALDWLRSHGRDALHLTSETTLDAVPVLAAVLVVDSISAEAPPGAVRDLCGDLAVRLCRHLGLHAARSRHVEPVVGLWRSGSPTTGFDDLWRRLDWMVVEPDITIKERDGIRTVDRGIRARTTVRPEPDLNAVSGALAASVGLPVDYDEVSAHSRDLGRLVGLARALTPHPSGEPAQRVLLDPQRALLRNTLARLIKKPPVFVADRLIRLLHDHRHDEDALNRTIAALEEGGTARPAAGPAR